MAESLPLRNGIIKGLQDLNEINDVGLIELHLPAPIIRFLRFHIFTMLLKFFLKDTTLWG